ncbi:MAG TPA: efflux RND transporter periplasmic adaptor subunit, partial [Pyrinomonadaceae bacterium]|nr:efflux RND transporter periplasmic adaptor subunit [Pyrinomonadaceae bacterium]
MRAVSLNRITVGLLFTALITSSCSGDRAADRRGNSNAENETPPVAITTAKVEARNVPAYIQATGSLIADEVSDVAPKVAGKVANVSVNVGDFVSQGAVIIKVDDSDARRQLAAAEARVKQEIASVRQAEARLGLEPNGRFNASRIPEVRAAGAAYEQAEAELRQAQANEERYRDLVKTGDVAMATYEQYRTTRDTAVTRVNSAREQLEAAVNTARQSNQAIASAQASVEAARTEVGTAQQALADTVVRAPFSGFVSSRPVAVGEYVSSASIVATLLRSNPIKIQIQVAESDVPSVVVGRGVSIQVDAYKDRNFAGTVTAINPAVDPSSRSTVVEASIENSDNALRSGMFGTARITKEG